MADSPAAQHRSLGRLPDPLQQVDGTWVLHRGRKLTYFGGCDYLRLACHAAVRAAATTAMAQFGLNVAASRLTTGNHRLYIQLEDRLASFFGAEQAVLVPTGYVGNLMAIQALGNGVTHAILDEQSHPSLVDAARNLGCPAIAFKHLDPSSLARALKRLGPACRTILLTDGVFARDGAIAPLADYLRYLPARSLVILDDAHGAGILGAHGRGTLEYLGLPRRNVVQTVTLSKAFGAYGGAILTSRDHARQIVARSGAFAGSTPVPLPLAGAALVAIDLVEAEPARRQRLLKNAATIKEALRTQGIEIPDNPSPIISITPSTRAGTERLKRRLEARDIFPSLIRYPGGPAGAYFRFAISSEHTPTQLGLLIDALVFRTTSR